MKTQLRNMCLAAVAAAAGVCGAAERAIPASQGANRNPKGDVIEVTTKCIRVNGEPKVPVMGEIHYSRVPEGEWTDYVRKMKDGGLTMIATYVFWNHHEENEGVFDFSGRRDLSRFLSVCEEQGLPVVLRLGPWCHGECREGGFPDWLIDRIGDNKRLRSVDAEYMAAVERYWTRVFAEVESHLWKNGGCVAGVQIENECRGPWPYMQALKDLAVRIGFDVPFYTRTGWPEMRGRVAYGELLPLFGDYADGFWDRNLKEPSPGNYKRAFRFSLTRVSANIATEQLPQSLVDDKATAEYPYFTCELGGGMPSSYHRRVRVTPMDTYAMAVVKLGSGSNLLGYYMYAGGTNPNRPEEGVFFNESQKGRFTAHNDLPPFSYEFYGPIGECGDTTLSWHLLKKLHAFCANFAADFALAEPEVLDGGNARRGPFLFHSEYVRAVSTNSVPYIVPQNWKTRLGTIKSASAQPVEWRGDTLVMMKIPGMEPKVEFDGEPFKVEFTGFPVAADVPRKVVAAPAVRKTKEAGAPREVATGRMKVAEQPGEPDWADAAVWEIDVPETLRDGRKVMEVDYLGDVARVYVDGTPVADDFYKGLPLKCALWRLPKGRVTVRILPWSDSPLIYVEPPFRPARTGAEINAVRVVDIAGCPVADCASAADANAGPAARVVRVDSPVAVWTNAAGRAVADFGNDMFGSAEVVPGADGVEVWVGEKLSGDGVDRAPPGSVRAARLPLVADKRNTGKDAVPIPAEFGVVMPFRYAEYDAAPGLEVRRRTLIVPMDKAASSFECSDEKLNRVWRFCKQTILATSFAGVYVDGDRERIPYEADAYLNMLGEQAVWADGAMAKATIEWLAEKPTWPTEWSQLFVSFVHGYYMATGDRGTFDRYMPLCRERMRVGKVRRDGLVARKTKNIVDWPAGERDGYDMGVGINAVVNAFYWRNLRELGEEKEAGRVKASFARVFVDEAAGLVRDGEGSTHHSLHANALALSLGLVPEAHRARAWEFCKSRKMACSPYFAQFLLEAAFEMDDPDYAIELMTAEDERSWLGMMRDGATMTMEAWNQKAKPNQDWNHAWSTAPLNIAMRKILGVEPVEPGYAAVRIRPSLGPLSFAKGKVPTVRGAIEVDCSRDALAVVVPGGVRAEVVLPWNGETRHVGEGRHVFPSGEPGLRDSGI